LKELKNYVLNEEEIAEDKFVKTEKRKDKCYKLYFVEHQDKYHDKYEEAMKDW
jgi:hypothetical protein